MAINRFAMFFVGACVFAAPALAQAPVAIVEDVVGNSGGVDFMDYLETGKVIHLGVKDMIVLSYLKTCVRETITGGTITIGSGQSDVQSGQVERTTVDCEVGKMIQASQQANETAGLVFRSLRPPKAIKPAHDPQFTLYGLCPIFEVNGSGTLVIERLDKPGERYVLPIAQKQLMHGTFYDFAANGKSLAAGGVYGAAWSTHQVVFKVDPGAKPGRTAIVGRLLRLRPAS
jgi:hypothetical protein